MKIKTNVLRSVTKIVCCLFKFRDIYEGSKCDLYDIYLIYTYFKYFTSLIIKVKISFTPYMTEFFARFHRKCSIVSRQMAGVAFPQ